MKIGRGKDDNDHRSSSSFVFHRSNEGQKKKKYKNDNTSRRFHVWEEWKQEDKVRTMTITNRCHRCLSFTWMTKAKNKRHEDDGFYHCLLCLRGARTKGEEDDDDHKSLSSIFHRNDEGIKKRRHTDDSFVLLSLCLRGARVRGGGKDDND